MEQVLLFDITLKVSPGVVQFHEYHFRDVLVVSAHLLKKKKLLKFCKADGNFIILGPSVTSKAVNELNALLAGASFRGRIDMKLI